MKYLLIIIIVLLLSFLITTNVHSDTQQLATTSAPEVPKLTQVEYTHEFEEIGRCESNHELHAKSRTSSASGEYQFINASWYHYGKELWGQDFYEKNIWSTDNRELAWYVYKKYGTGDWNASKSCWGVIK